MHVLAIDTALQACAAAVFETGEGAVLAAESLDMGRGHAEALVPLIGRVMERSGRDFAGVDRIAVTVGPGSFTGLRVGISAARGIALAAAVPAVGISTLTALAAPHIAERRSPVVISAIDARHGSVYLQVFATDGRAVIAPTHVAVEDAVRAATVGPTLLVGSGAELIARNWPADHDPPLAVDGRAAPDIVWVARLGALADPQSAPANPLYLRKPDARPQDAARLPRQ